jgi:hypothetical protein
MNNIKMESIIQITIIICIKVFNTIMEIYLKNIKKIRKIIYQKIQSKSQLKTSKEELNIMDN